MITLLMDSCKNNTSSDHELIMNFLIQSSDQSKAVDVLFNEFFDTTLNKAQSISESAIDSKEYKEMCFSLIDDFRHNLWRITDEPEDIILEDVSIGKDNQFLVGVMKDYKLTKLYQTGLNIDLINAPYFFIQDDQKIGMLFPLNSGDKGVIVF